MLQVSDHLNNAILYPSNKNLTSRWCLLAFHHVKVVIALGFHLYMCSIECSQTLGLGTYLKNTQNKI